MKATAVPKRQGMYDPANEHDACGVGFIAHIKGQKSHSIIEQGLLILKNLDHRGAVGADALMGDGAGILIQLPDTFLRAEMAKQGVTLPSFGEYGVGMCFLPGKVLRAWPVRKKSSVLFWLKVKYCSAGAMCLSPTRCQCHLRLRRQSQ